MGHAVWCSVSCNISVALDCGRDGCRANSQFSSRSMLLPHHHPGAQSQERDWGYKQHKEHPSEAGKRCLDATPGPVPWWLPPSSPETGNLVNLWRQGQFSLILFNTLGKCQPMGFINSSFQTTSSVWIRTISYMRWHFIFHWVGLAHQQANCVLLWPTPAPCITQHVQRWDRSSCALPQVIMAPDWHLQKKERVRGCRTISHFYDVLCMQLKGDLRSG